MIGNMVKMKSGIRLICLFSGSKVDIARNTHGKKEKEYMLGMGVYITFLE